MGYRHTDNHYKNPCIQLFRECYAMEKIHGCLLGRTKIRMADGTSVPLSSVRVGQAVACVKDGVASTTTVTETFKNGVKGRWLIVHAAHAMAGRGGSFIKLTATPEHRFLRYGTEEYVPAADLRVGDRVAVLRSDVRLTPLHSSVILGKLLGDGFLSKTASSASLQFGHCSQDAEYVEWTCRGLGELAGKNRGAQTSGYGTSMVRARTVSSAAVLSQFGDFYTADKKVVPEWVADLLDPIAIAFWYMDDGSLATCEGQEDRAAFATNGFSRQDCEVLARGLAKFGIEAIPYEASGWRLRVNRESAERLFLLVAPYIPPCMQRKLPLRYRGGPGWLPNIGVQFAPTVTPQVITAIDTIDHEYAAFDLETEEHNYITAAGFVVHNSSANVTFRNNRLIFFGGGAGYEPFKALFDEPTLLKAFEDHGAEDIVVYGEAYGGKMQKMSDTYGPHLRFVAFEVCSNGKWFDVPSAEYVARKLGFDFVPYARVSTDQASLDFERDRPSRQAIKNGCGDNKMAEGVVLRPIRELVDQQGGRIITKHKRPEFSERKSKADTQSTEKLQVLNKAQAVADEFVTEMRLEHVLDALKAAMPVARDLTRADIPAIIAAMLEDVGREGVGEFEMSKEARKAIGDATAELVRKKF